MHQYDLNRFGVWVYDTDWPEFVPTNPESLDHLFEDGVPKWTNQDGSPVVRHFFMHKPLAVVAVTNFESVNVCLPNTIICFYKATIESVVTQLQRLHTQEENYYC